MKRKLIVLMAVMLAAVSSAWAEKVSTDTPFTNSDGMVFTLKPDGTAVVGDNRSFNVTSGVDLEIPELVSYGNEDYTVEEISDDAFNFTTTNTRFENLKIPSTIKKIGANAFSNFQYLSAIYFNVVEGCEIQETSFKLENRISYLPLSLTLCSGVKEIPGYILYKVSPGTYTVPEGVTKLGKGAFYNCKYTTDIQLPSTLKEIGDYAFYSCNQLVPFEIPEGVTTVGSHAFEGCSRNTFNTVVLPSTVTSVGDNAFKGCTNLTKLEFGSSVATIGAGVIEGCTNLKSIYVLNPAPPTVGENDFSALDEIYVPMGSKSAYDSDSFWTTYSAKIKELYDPNNILVYYYTETFLEAEVGVYEAYDHTKIEGELEIPSTVEYGGKTYTVTRLRGNAFKGCTNLTTVKLPSTIEYIGGEAFSGCTSLKKIYLPSAKVPTLLGEYNKNFYETPNGLKIVVREEKYNDFTAAAWPSSLTFEQLKSFTYKTSDGKPVAIGKEGLTGATYIYNSVDLKSATIIQYTIKGRFMSR